MMSSIHQNLVRYILAGTLLLGLTSCSMSTPKPTYYTLTADETIAATSSTQASSTLAIGIGPVNFPSELDRPSIVTRSGQSRLVINEFHRWGGSLEKNFLKVLADNLAQELQTDQVMVRPWEHYFQPDIRLTLDVHQFDGRLGKSATLKLTWTLFTIAETGKGKVHRNAFTEPVENESYDALVGAQSRLIKTLSKEIAAAIGAL